ncbi:LADA_0C07756g1_1 [Lachancea dasiensis]|uniref:LADA_0C07756g1_1 n=1 Tax=Lachancea dasiensis TaxID=1072105 RepID=A0A1G4J0C6_9SACH|nr:LADA_0C07756g1_1 [Lachancea dasiensis]
MATYKKRIPSLYLLKSNSSAQFMPAQDFELIPQSEEPLPNGEWDSNAQQHASQRTLSPLRYINFSIKPKKAFVIPLSVVLSWLLVGFTVWQYQERTSRLATSPVNGPNSGITHSGRDFDISSVLDGEFSFSDDPFSFIKPGSLYQSQDNDAGLYLTIDDSNGIPKYVARKLADGNFYEDLGRKEFTYHQHEYNVAHFEVSHRLDFAIMSSDLEREYRHSSKGFYWLKDIKKSIITPISPFPGEDALYKLSYARFSPSRNFLYFVFENDLFIQNVASKVVQRITTNGSDHISNGKPDWVYEEEVLASDQAVWWAHDDSKLVWAQFDDSKVQQETLPLYINNELYDGSQTINYPKPGTPNPEYSLWSYNLMTGALHTVPKGEEKERILYHAQWIDSNNFMFKDTDRGSQVMDVKVFDLSTYMVSTVRTINATRYGGWIERTHDVQVIPIKESLNRNEVGYVDVQVDDNGFPHLFYFPNLYSDLSHQLTSGQWEVTGKGIIGYDYDAETILFLANLQNRFSQHLFFVSVNTSPSQEVHAPQDPNEKEAFYDFELSLSCRFGVKRYLGPNAPISDAGDLILLLQNDESRAITQLTDNTDMLTSLEKYDIPSTNRRSMKLDDGVDIDYMEILPADTHSVAKRPLLVHVYGGPGSHTVDSRFSISLDESLASSEGAVVLKIEPRGTGGRGWEYRRWAKGKLGYWEPRDILSVTKNYMKRHAEYIDTDRVAIWGWSYGGFVTLKTLELDGGSIFKYGVAVAPVTDWRYYNSIYTERYMGSLETNEVSYEENALINDIGNLAKAQRFLLMHGSADDNVHLKNTMHLLDQLNINGVQDYDLSIFPDSEHSIMFHNAGNIVYHRLSSWLRNAFSGRFDALVS